MAMNSHVPWALVLVALAVVAASGQGFAWAQAARNETTASANGDTLNALLSTTSRAFSKSACVESIRIMKHTSREGSYPERRTSFPPDNFTPPGAEAWCDCLEANEPTGGIPSDYEGVFNTCRDQVLVGSDYNAMDMCRGMVRLYGYDFWYNRKTFCSRGLCEGVEGERYGDRYYKYYADAFNLGATCGSPCMAELSAGYCAKYRLTYGGWFERYSPNSLAPAYSITRRGVLVDGKRGWSQRDRDPIRTKIQHAEEMCNTLYLTDQGRCCTYERGYAMLSQCCYLKDGALEFNCANSYGGARLRYNCMKLGHDPYDPYNISTGFTRLHDACKVLIDYYMAHPTYQQAKLAKLPGGQTSVVFPEAFMDDFCVSKEFYDLQPYDVQNDFTPGTREYCCLNLNALFRDLVENCLPGAGSYRSLGATRLPPSVDGPPQTPSPSLGPSPSPSLGPSPPSCDPCSYVDENGDCKSVCKNTEECTVRKGRAICVRCDYFRQDFPDGKNRQCCQLRGGDSGTLCRAKVNNKGEKNECVTNEGPWTNDKGAVRNPQPYTIEAVRNVCNARNNYWVNRKLCKVKEKPNREKRCKYINKRKRHRILTGR